MGEGLDIVLDGKAAVICRVPVLACDNCFTTGFAPVNQRVGYVNGAVTFGDGQRTARAEIILQIDQEQGALLHETSLFVRCQFAAQVLHHRAANGLNVQILTQ